MWVVINIFGVDVPTGPQFPIDEAGDKLPRPSSYISSMPLSIGSDGE